MSAACLAREGHTVVGVDVSTSKVGMVNAGTATIVETGIGELVAEMVAAKRLTATTDVADAVKRTEISCLRRHAEPANGGLDLAYVRACRDGDRRRAARTRMRGTSS